MKFVVGIGNPGRSYAKTRHNAGFMVLEALAKARFPGKDFRKKKDWQARVIEEDDVLLCLPETFVNLTGGSAQAIRMSWKAKPSDFLVVCDDVNLGFGKMRLRASGSAGGHHGLESLIQAFGTDEFSRLRVGVGSDAMPTMDLAPFVLSKFGPDEEGQLPGILDKAVQVCDSWIRLGATEAERCLSKLQSKQ